MFKKNIYLIYAAGYSGSYTSWCLYKSEVDNKDTTVDNPINSVPSDKYGGVGTSHLHHRIPTHAGIDPLMYWMILNKPIDKKIYLVNSWKSNWMYLFRTIHHIMNFDRDPVIIHIASDDKDYRALGHINAITKWPLFFEIEGLYEKYGKDFCNLTKGDIQARNMFVKNYDEIFREHGHMNFTDDDTTTYHPMPSYKKLRTGYDRWYTCRNTNNPHEVNETMFIEPHDAPKHFYSVDLKEIYELDFPIRLQSIVGESDAGDFDFDYVKNFHHNYIASQPNLKFITEIQQFRQTKLLTEYLTSHPLIEAEVIRELYTDLPEDWESKTLQEIVKAL